MNIFYRYFIVKLFVISGKKLKKTVKSKKKLNLLVKIIVSNVNKFSVKK